MKKILVLYYSQSGQLRTISDLLTQSFQQDNNYSVHFEEIKPVTPFPFPWSAFAFFNAFPETYHQQKVVLQPISEVAKQHYDLVIVAYQPWFLSPSPVMSSFLRSDEAKQILANKPVVTVIGSRNMWLDAQEKVKRYLREAKANLVGNIAMVDNSKNLTSVITILRWMLTGKKDAFWIFPQAGVQQADLDKLPSYGQLVKKTFAANDFTSLQNQLNEAGAVVVKPDLVLLERRGNKAFPIWANFVSRGGASGSFRRVVRVYLFMFLLPTAVFVLSPIISLITVLVKWMQKEELQREVDYFRQNSLR